MIGGSFFTKALAVLLAVAGTLAVMTAFVAVLLTTWTCGVRPAARGIFSGLALFVTADPDAYDAPHGCAMPVVPIRVVDLIVLLLLVAGAIVALVAYGRYKESDAALLATIRSRPGFASRTEVAQHLSASAVLRRAKQLRPGQHGVKPTDVGWRVGRARGLDVYVSIEDSVALEGPPRAGKGYRVLISAILDWAGPLITTSTTNDNLTATMRMRAVRGNVHVFDPQGLSGIRNTLRISPIVGCEDPLVAVQRGQAIVTGTALGTSSTNQEWADVAGTVLSRLLHAAALSGRTVADLYEWGSTPALAHAAVDILRSDGRSASGWADGLEAILVGDEKLLSSTWFGVQAAVAPLAIPQIREALLPAHGAGFDPDEFLRGENTLYLIGSGAGAGAMGGFLSGILDDVVEVARRRALASDGARLPLPLGLILDEIANMFRWSALPRVMAEGGGRGICTFVVLQALSQAETAWSRAEADTIWSAGTAKILLGGASHVQHLRDVEALLGTRDQQRTERSWSTHQPGSNLSERHDRLPLMTVDEIRRMPATAGLLAYRNRRGVLLDLAGWDERHDARRIKAGKTETETEQRGVFESDYAARTNMADPDLIAEEDP